MRYRLVVETNLRGRDLARFVADAQRVVENQVKVPLGYWIEWGGQFENLQRASARLVIVVPMALFLIFVLLYSTSAGAEVQRPLAMVVIGGLTTSTALTLLVLPMIYAWSEGRRETREDKREGATSAVHCRE